MKTDLSPLWKSLAPLGKLVQQLFAEHHFLTIVCGFFVVMMTISFYRLLKSISPALVALIFLLVFFILLLHWTQTRTEPALLKPAVDWLVAFLPPSPYTHAR